MQLWSLNKAIALMLEATGPELGRAAFMNTLVTTPEFDNGIYAPVAFTVDDHFGGTGAHLLDADCARQAVHDRRPVPRAELTRWASFSQRRAGLLIGLGLAVALIVVLVVAGEKQSLVIGTITGSAYGLVALGLVLIYKSSGVFNFAQGEFGTVAAVHAVPAALQRRSLRLGRARRPAGGGCCSASSPNGSSSARCSTRRA